MPEPNAHPGSDKYEQLVARLQELKLARAHLRVARRRPSRWEVDPSRADLLAALEAYAAAITTLGAPLPHRLQAEIDLYGRLADRR